MFHTLARDVVTRQPKRTRGVARDGSNRTRVIFARADLSSGDRVAALIDERASYWTELLTRTSRASEQREYRHEPSHRSIVHFGAYSTQFTGLQEEVIRDARAGVAAVGDARVVPTGNAGCARSQVVVPTQEPAACFSGMHALNVSRGAHSAHSAPTCS